AAPFFSRWFNRCRLCILSLILRELSKRPYMVKRNRSKSRFEDMYHLPVTAHTNNWSSEQVRQQREELIVRNHDLVDEKARETARREFDDIVNPGLAGALPAIHALT